MKVSKESIVGVMAALKRYASRDHAAEYAGWQATIDQISDQICEIPELRVTRLTRGMNGQPYPNLLIESGSERNGVTVRNLLLSLRNRPRRIVLAEDEQNPDRAFLYAQCLQPGDAEEIVSAIQQAVSSHRVFSP
jgi:L-seryl-tRNA(Ser) seleniumtransferase